MCGIAGIVSRRRDDHGLAEAVRRMTGLQAHRGPDGEGFYDAPGVSLGHRRLAIIDLCQTGEQPMADARARYWLIFNGEIYNYIELREELSRLGHTFRGYSDSEVLVTAYAEWGADSLSRLRGMFAFVIWDAHDERLFAARDRLGIKPFHYVADDQRFAFASELKALLEFVPARRASPALARQFLAWNLLEHEAAQTMIEGIHRLPAAHYLTWDAREGMKIARYWSLAVDDRLQSTADERRRLTVEFRDQFTTAIRLHLRADVEVGSCLSGGLDSSSIVCVANEELRRAGAEGRQHSFSAHFPGLPIDETRYIEIVAAAIGLRTHFTEPTGEQLVEDLQRWIWHQEEPVGGTSTYAQYCVARLARGAGVKVLLDGQGADEQLAGYRKFAVVYVRQLLRAGHPGAALRNALAFFANADVLRTTRFRQGLRYVTSAAPWDGDAPPKPEGLGLGTSLAARSEADLLRFSLPLLLRYEDRNTMAFGVEARVPFVDHVFVEWMAKLPADMRLDGGWTKRVLRDALKGTLPEPIRTRKTKLGFSTPHELWMEGALGAWACDIVAAPRHLLDVMTRSQIGVVVNGFRRRKSHSFSDLLFRLAIYEAWGRIFLETA